MQKKIYYTDRKGAPGELIVSTLPLCPFCVVKRAEHAIHLEIESHVDDENNHCGDTAQIVLCCKNSDCSKLFIAIYYLSPNDFYPYDGYEIVETHPAQPFPEISIWLKEASLPEDVQKDFSEAVRCIKNGLYQAFAAMARRTIHSICADKKCVGKDLYEQIESLRLSSVFSDDVAERAHELRASGRDGAHPEFERIDEEHAKEALELLFWITKVVYQPPPPTDPERRKKTKKRYTIPKK